MLITNRDRRAKSTRETTAVRDRTCAMRFCAPNDTSNDTTRQQRITERTTRTNTTMKMSENNHHQIIRQVSIDTTNQRTISSSKSTCSCPAETGIRVNQSFSQSIIRSRSASLVRASRIDETACEVQHWRPARPFVANVR